MVIRKVVIPAAGLGTRLYPITKSQPKEMLPLGRKPAIQLVLEEVISCGLRQVLIITGQHKRTLEDHFDINAGNGATPFLPPELSSGLACVFYVRQSQPRGLGDAVAKAEPFICEEPFAVALGDAIIHSPLREPLLARMICLFEQEAPAAVVAVRQVPTEQIGSYGMVKPADGSATAEAFLLSDIVEKPRPAEAPSNWAITGRYLFTPLIFEYLRLTPEGKGGEVQLTDAIRALIAAGHPVWAVKLAEGETRYDVGNFFQYSQAFIEIALRDPEVGEALRSVIAKMLGIESA